MIGQSLPIKINVCFDGVKIDYLFEYRDGSYQINGQRLSEQLPAHKYIKNWFTIDHLPPPDQCHYIQCHVNSLFFPKKVVCLLVGYAEKYRKYFYPLQLDLEQMTLYLTGQPIYYNFNQAVALDVSVEPPVLRIHSFSKANSDTTIYQPRSKRGLDLYWEPPVNLVRAFTLNLSPEMYKKI